MTNPLRVGTWNLAGRWTTAHCQLLLAMDCDVLLLTEVTERLEIPGHTVHLSEHTIATRRRWAAVVSRTDLAPRPDPHPASALAVVDSVSYCSSILPWRSCGSSFPWTQTRHAEKTRHALEQLTSHLPDSPLIWGGDWNHALSGREHAGSIGGREHLLAAIDTLGLRVPTATLSHAIPGLLTIDHIAVPAAAGIASLGRVAAVCDERRLSDHDAYVVATELQCPDPARALRGVT